MKTDEAALRWWEAAPWLSENETSLGWKRFVVNGAIYNGKSDLLYFFLLIFILEWVGIYGDLLGGVFWLSKKLLKPPSWEIITIFEEVLSLICLCPPNMSFGDWSKAYTSVSSSTIIDDSCSITSIPLVSFTSSNTPISYLGRFYWSFQLKLIGDLALTGDSIGVS